jgi:hypothetical protein
MVWKATLYDKNNRPWEFLVTFSQIVNGSVRIEHDTKEDTKSDDSRSGCGSDYYTAELCKKDRDMCD